MKFWIFFRPTEISPKFWTLHAGDEARDQPFVHHRPAGGRPPTKITNKVYMCGTAQPDWISTRRKFAFCGRCPASSLVINIICNFWSRSNARIWGLRLKINIPITSPFGISRYFCTDESVSVYLSDNKINTVDSTHPSYAYVYVPWTNEWSW